jgi:predicted metalloprotease
VPALAAALLVTACSTDSLITTERADLIGDEPSAQPGDPASDPGSDDPGDDPAGDDPVSDPAGDPASDDEAAADPSLVDEAAIDFGPNKPPRDYDDFLLATMVDLERWWAVEYPAIYGRDFDPLEGRVYAAYPDRPDDIPGCGTPRTTYEEISQYGAFYCADGDFIVYDDGDGGLLATLAADLGPVSIAVVLAHEYGHAVQLRNGDILRGLPTIVTEQQADCFAGAWIGRVSRGEAPGLTIADRDVRSSLIAMLEVRDPVGLNQFTPGGHGSGFDRIGAFQEGFEGGAERCSTLIDDPLPLVPNEFVGSDDFLNEGNAAFGYGEDQLLGFLPEDLNLYWDVERDADFPDFDALRLVAVQSESDVDCDELSDGFDRGAAVCVATGIVYLNEPVARELYGQRELGDFSIGYLIGIAWADAVLASVGSDTDGEERALLADCLAGAWVRTVIPVDNALPEPRAEGRTSVVSPGDLDEAVQTAILFGDLDGDDDEIGSAFEKIDAFRTGVLGGLAACEI